MAVIVTHRDVVDQSNAVFAQFGESKWIPFAKENAKLPRVPAERLRNSGIGRFLVCAAMGESLEESVPFLKKYRDRVDVLTCDKGFGALLEQGIKADYVMICDCNIPFRWLEKYVAETKGVHLISTVYANPEWTTVWQGERTFYVNKDAIQSQNHFLPIFGRETRVIPASTNVSNAMLVFFMGADDVQQYNWSGYDRVLLTGYDYSWRPGGKYYAFADPRPKRFYMNHRTMLDINNDYVLTSENLFFSAKWMFSYMTSYKLPAVNCSERGILFVPQRGPIEAELRRMTPDPGTRARVRQQFELTRQAKVLFDSAAGLFNKQREDLYVNR